MFKRLSIIALMASVVAVVALVPLTSQAFLSPIWLPFECGSYSGCGYGGYGYAGCGGYGYGAYGGYGYYASPYGYGGRYMSRGARYRR